MKVVDASAIAAVLFGEPSHDDVLERLDGEALIASTLLPFEVASTCVKKIREQPDARATFERAFASLDDWKISYLDVEVQTVIDVAMEAGLSWYDASYLWLARELGVELVTLDQELDRAAALPQA